MSHQWPEQKQGELNPKARFTQQQADLLRDRYELGGVTIRQLAEETGASRQTILRVLHRERYTP